MYGISVHPYSMMYIHYTVPLAEIDPSVEKLNKTVKKFSFCMQVRPWGGLLVVLLYWLELVEVSTVLDDQIQPPGHGLHHGLDVVDVLSLALWMYQICLRLHSNKWRCFLIFLRWNHPAVHSSVATLLLFIEKWDKEFIFVSIFASDLVQGCSYTLSLSNPTRHTVLVWKQRNFLGNIPRHTGTQRKKPQGAVTHRSDAIMT